MMRLLVSARSVDEALLCADAGVDFIDLKEPGRGALGGLPIATIAAVVASLRSRQITLPVSATIGDWPMHARMEICERVDAVAACGVDYVKVGISGEDDARTVLDRLAASPHAVVPVFIADAGVDNALVAHALALRFPALMLDTADKRAGSLFDVMAAPALSRFVAQVRHGGAMAGLAGALRLAHLPQLAALAPDFAGFRGAVCAGDRSAAIDGARLRGLIDAARMRGLVDAARNAEPDGVCNAEPDRVWNA
jgi:(5-formylfuran-3-yl)methyl phosphate synthase